ncbi:MAG: molybdenum cofactor biosynthesis protein MoaB [Deltaproteobacteria bacterium]|nr:molybdenum cofactor biosynthesis protein MoaB [Deltaproteobacteria bacterium]
MSHGHEHREPRHGHGSNDASPVAQHRSRSKRPARCMVITVSDTRDLADDRSGQRASDLLTEAGHVVRTREIVVDERAAIAALVRAAVADPEIDAVVLTGGTGIAPRDVTYEAIDELLDKPLHGFGELFRSLSYAEIGSAAMLSRAIGGVVGRTVVFALPGSTKAVELGVTKLIAPELGHMIGLLAP